MYTGIIPLYIVPSLTRWRVPGINLSGVLLSCLEYTTIPFSNYACAIDSALCKTPYSWNWFLNQIFPSFSWQSYTTKNPNALLTPLTARADARTSFSYLPLFTCIHLFKDTLWIKIHKHKNYFVLGGGTYILINLGLQGCWQNSDMDIDTTSFRLIGE